MKKYTSKVFHIIILGCISLFGCGNTGNTEPLEKRAEKSKHFVFAIYKSDFESRYFKKEIKRVCNSYELLDYLEQGYFAQIQLSSYTFDGVEYDILLLTNLSVSDITKNDQFRICAYPLILKDNKVEKVKMQQYDDKIRIILSLKSEGQSKAQNYFFEWENGILPSIDSIYLENLQKLVPEQFLF